MNKANLDGLDISKHLGINMQLLPPVLWMVDNSIPKTNLYPVDSAIRFVRSYPLDSDLSVI